MRFLLIVTSLALLCSCNDYRTINLPNPQINEIGVNENFRIILPENHTQGHIWQLSKNFENGTAEYINSVWHGNDKGVYFNFKGKSIGQTELRFDLIKYRDTLDTKTFIIKVK